MRKIIYPLFVVGAILYTATAFAQPKTNSDLEKECFAYCTMPFCEYDSIKENVLNKWEEDGRVGSPLKKVKEGLLEHCNKQNHQ